MSVIVNDTGFHTDDWAREWSEAFPQTPPPGLPSEARALDIASDTDPSRLGELLDAEMIRINFPSFADGRGFTLARMLRLKGYRGRLRASGHVIADQYAMARRAGFDEVEISDDLAARQPQDHWRFRANWQAHDYQSRLRRAVAL